MVFASIREHAVHRNFFASTSRDKLNFALRAASSLDRLNFESKSGKGNILRAVKNFHGPFITPRSKYKNKVFTKVYLQYHIC